MKKLILCASVAAMGAMTSCEKELLIPEDSKPEWLGESVYEELRSGSHLTGTFNTYLRLVDDLGYAEVLSKTGSKTVFPANDEAFERFFRSNMYGVTSYEQLTENMKKQLLYSSMLDNAMLTSMLSNIKADDNNVTRGEAMKHENNVSVIDSITTLFNASTMPKNNAYWQQYFQKGINVVYDATKPMMVHFTREQMLNNSITTTGVDSDFGILRGDQVGNTIENSDTAYIFQTRIINQDVTCTNGYVHQVQDVIVPPGNVGEVLRRESNTQLFSRMLDYYCAPYYSAQTTNNYNAWAIQNGKQTIDSIFAVRYFSTVSEGRSVNGTDPAGGTVSSVNRLAWDPGWNQYYSSSSSAQNLSDIGAILVPTDEVLKEYFLPGGGGAFFIDHYGTPNSGLANTEENLPENLDNFYNYGREKMTSIINNLMQSSFVGTVPSKFGTLTDKGSGDFMGLTPSIINVKDGRYDVSIANNGVIYKINQMIAPDEFQSVLGPARIYPELSVMDYFTQDRSTATQTAKFGAEMYYFLMAMKANYIYFMPSNDAMKGCFIDPVSLGTTNPRALEFYHVNELNAQGRPVDRYGVKIHDFDPATGEISETVREDVQEIYKSGNSAYKSQVTDFLNYNTIVLEEGEEIVNNYYRTKHGGAVKIENFQQDASGNFSGTVYGGAQIDNNVPAAHIETGWKEKNGYAFRLDNVIQPAITSVSTVLENAGRFQKFFDICAIFEQSELLEWAGIAGTAEIGTAPQERYIVFSPKKGKALDNNINFFNGYNYTFYAPNDEAIDAAYALGLPTYEQINEIYDKYVGNEEEYGEDEVISAKAQVLNMLNSLRAFVRYHFQNTSVFADNQVDSKAYQSLYSSELGIPVNITSESRNGILTVKDENGSVITINASDSGKLVNKMARDYEYDKEKEQATAIAVSSFATIHEVSQPLCYSKNGRYDSQWSTAEARSSAAKNYERAKYLANHLKD